MNAPVFQFQTVDAVVGRSMLSKGASGAGLKCSWFEGALLSAGFHEKKSASAECSGCC
jgi:predicted NAD/FAD-binding protein